MIKNHTDRVPFAVIDGHRAGVTGRINLNLHAAMINSHLKTDPRIHWRGLANHSMKPAKIIARLNPAGDGQIGQGLNLRRAGILDLLAAGKIDGLIRPVETVRREAGAVYQRIILITALVVGIAVERIKRHQPLGQKRLRLHRQSQHRREGENSAYDVFGFHKIYGLRIKYIPVDFDSPYQRLHFCPTWPNAQAKSGQSAV